MAANERDDTGEWLLPAGGGPPTLYGLERRVELALTVSRAAETAALEIGAASIEAAQQARHAAECAERASLAAVASGALPVASGNGAEAGDEGLPPAEVPAPAGPTAAEPIAATPPVRSGNELHDERLRHFAERADRLSGRLRALELSK